MASLWSVFRHSFRNKAYSPYWSKFHDPFLKLWLHFARLLLQFFKIFVTRTKRNCVVFGAMLHHFSWHVLRCTEYFLRACEFISISTLILYCIEKITAFIPTVMSSIFRYNNKYIFMCSWVWFVEPFRTCLNQIFESCWINMEVSMGYTSDCVNNYLNSLNFWNKATGINAKILNIFLTFYNKRVRV